MRILHHVLFPLLLGLGVLTGYKSQAEIKADPQDSLVLVRFNTEVQKYGWPRLWDTSTPVATWEGVTMNGSGKVIELALQDNNGFNTFSLPDAIEILKDLDQLSSLSVATSHLQHISPKIGELRALRNLVLGYNDITSLPETIGNLDKLTWLSLGYNELAGLPESMGNLTNLGRLDISHNQLSGLPDTFAQLTSLTHLNFSGNALEAFPASIVDLESLIEIMGEENSMKGGIPEALWERGEKDLVPVPLHLFVSDNELSGRVLGEDTDEYLVGTLDISGNKYTLQDIYPDYDNLQLYNCNLTFMPQGKFGPLLQTIIPGEGSPHLTIEVEGFTPLEGSQVQWFYYEKMSDRGWNEKISFSAYPVTTEKSIHHQGFYYCKVTHPDLPGYEVTSNTVRVIVDNKAPVLNTRNITFRQGATPAFLLSASDDFSYTQQLQWTIPGETAHLSFSSGKIIAKDPAWTGRDTLTVSVADEHGNTTTAGVFITILPRENAPPVVRVPDIYMMPDPKNPYCNSEGFPGCMYVWETAVLMDQFVSDDFDAVEDLHFEIKGSDEMGMINDHFYASIGELDGWGPELNALAFASQDTAVSFTLIVKDNEGGVTEEQITLIGKADNQPPVFSPVPEQFMVKGTAFPPLDLKQYVRDDYTPVEDLSWQAYPGGRATIRLENGVAFLTPHDPDTGTSFNVVYEVYESFRNTTQIDVTYTILEEGLTISGTIHSDDQQPVAGVRLGGLPGIITTDIQGKFTAEVPSGWSGTITPSKPDFSFLPAVIEVSNLQASRTDQDFTATYTGAYYYTISGKVTESNGKPLPQVTISGFPESVITATDGTYAADVPEGWSGTVTASKPDFSFLPAAIEVSNLQASRTDQDFTATYTGAHYYTVSGKVTESNGNPLAQVTLSGFPETVVTATDGTYAAGVPEGWSGTITPSKPDFSFLPAAIEVFNLQASRTNQDFTAAYTGAYYYTVSGKVAESNGNPLAQVTLSGFPETVVTATDGTYAADVPEGWSGTITPSKPDFSFLPATIEVSNLQASRTNQDFTAAYTGAYYYTVSGKVAEANGNPLAQVTLSGFPESVVTATDGTYAADVPEGWSGTVTAAKEGYYFTPETLVLDNLQGDLEVQHFMAYRIITGMAERTAAKIILYPNPTRASVKVELSRPLKQSGHMVVVNPEGKIIWKTTVPAGTRHLTWRGTSRSGTPANAGLYLFRLREGNKILVSKKVIITR